MKISQAIKFLESQIKDPKKGLPEEIFYFASRITPMVNVDLLIKDENGRTLLAWRDDKFFKGWHIPGGIIRYKEKMETRAQKVIQQEIRTKTEFGPKPIAINEIIAKSDIRGHFISVLYKCFLSSKKPLKNKGLLAKDNGFLKWHETCPPDFLEIQKMYRKYITKNGC